MLKHIFTTFSKFESKKIICYILGKRLEAVGLDELIKYSLYISSRPYCLCLPRDIRTIQRIINKICDINNRHAGGNFIAADWLNSNVGCRRDSLDGALASFVHKMNE